MRANIPEDETPDQTVRREMVEPIRKWGPRLARAFAGLVIVVILVGAKFGKEIDHNTSANGHLIGVLEERQVLGCHRTNVERVQANKQNFADYQLFAFIYGTLATAKAHPAKPPTPTERKIGRAFTRGLKHDLDEKEYVPPTFCSAAAKRDLKRLYEPPQPVSFAAVHGKPPRAAFELQEGQ
jgi:hypothetical protein